MTAAITVTAAILQDKSMPTLLELVAWILPAYLFGVVAEAVFE